MKRKRIKIISKELVYVTNVNNFVEKSKEFKINSLESKTNFELDKINQYETKGINS
jgi:hypothetical protein